MSQNKCTRISNNTYFYFEFFSDFIKKKPEIPLCNRDYIEERVNEFYNKWLNDLEYINTTMRSIRKIQIDCSLLNLCNNKPELLNKEYDGYIFDKIVRHDGLYQYIVFLPELKMNSRITIRENMENYDMRKFQLYLFNAL